MSIPRLAPIQLHARRQITRYTIEATLIGLLAGAAVMVLFAPSTWRKR